MNIILGYILLNLSAFLYLKLIGKLTTMNTLLVMLTYNIFVIGITFILQGLGDIIFDGIFQHIKSR